MQKLNNKEQNNLIKEKTKLLSMTEKEQNNFWNTVIKHYKKNYSKEMIRTQHGYLFYWELLMFSDLKCLSKDAVICDGFLVKSEKEKVLYRGYDNYLAQQSKNREINAQITMIPLTYSYYLEYVSRKKQAEQINNI